MSAGFTSGPWDVHDTIDGPLLNTDVRERRTNRFVARCDPMNGRPHVDNCEANARLISAAPALFEAARLFAEVYDSGDERDGVDLMLRYNAALTAARGALAKARGEVA